MVPINAAEHDALTDTNPCCLIVIDGWGIAPPTSDPTSDAIRLAHTPNMKFLTSHHPNTQLEAHGRAVGLPAGLMGNSEVGHLNIGAGRVVYQDIVRIDMAIEDGTLAQHSHLQEAFKRASSGRGAIHFIGLLSNGGVHSHINHLKALVRYARDAAIPSTFIHAITDGRDTAPTSAIDFITEIQNFLNEELQYGQLATIIGRYYAMDRDQRWERTKMALAALINGVGSLCPPSELVSLLKSNYGANITDEFFKPIIINDHSNTSRIKEGDVVLFFNFRSDRMRQIVAALGLGQPEVQLVPPSNLSIYCMTRYNEAFPFPVLSPPQQLNNVLAEWISHLGLRQYHVAETEKYAHITFFFNGGREIKFSGEERLMIPSPKVATYDLQPAMSVAKVGEEVIKAINYGRNDIQATQMMQTNNFSPPYPFIMCNLAPPDMVGHTGHLAETIQAVEATDQAIGRIYQACQQAGYTLIITADHGNAEKMKSDDGSGQPHTAHTCAPVPLIVCPSQKTVMNNYKDSKQLKLRNGGALCDIAPTILQLMKLPIPPEMTGNSLLI